MLDRAIAAGRARGPRTSPSIKNYAPEIPPFPFDAELMERVFYNLVLNAAQATPPGGAVTVKTRADGRHGGDRRDRSRRGHRPEADEEISSIRSSPPSRKASASASPSSPRSWTNTAVR